MKHRETNTICSHLYIEPENSKLMKIEGRIVLIIRLKDRKRRKSFGVLWHHNINIVNNNILHISKLLQSMINI
jgi:hypothetical protein